MHGLHVIANFSVADKHRLLQYGAFSNFILNAIDDLGLTRVGEVFHNFPGGGFTAVVCLTESHLSIHTWPELNYITFDVFLSNYLKQNSDTTHRLYAMVREFFGARVLFEKIVER